MRKSIRNILRGLYFLLLGFALLSYAAPFVSPDHLPGFAIFGLLYPYLFIVQVVILLPLLLRRSRTAWFGLAVLVLGFPFLFRIFGVGSEPAVGDSDVSIVSFNARGTRYEPSTRRPDTITHEILSPYELICFQELSRSSFEKLAAPFGQYERLYSSEGGRGLLSRYPIVKSGEIDFSESINGVLWADVEHPLGVFRIYNVHLESNRVSGEISELRAQKLDERETWTEVRAVLGAISRRSARRAGQVARLREHLLASPHPVLVTGDFNDTPYSYTYRQMNQTLTDGFRRVGRGSGHSFAGAVPLLRIDYILADEHFSFVSYQTLRSLRSDHYPVAARLQFSVD